MFHHLFRFRRLLATAFLVVFVNVLAGQCYCASQRQLVAAERGTNKPAAKPAPMAPGHACCRATAARKVKLAAAKPASSSQSPKQSNQEDCCRKKATSLVAALDAPAAKQLLNPAPALLPPTAAFYFPAPARGQWDRTAAVRLLPPQHLPPKIPDIRIFLRSLTV